MRNASYAFRARRALRSEPLECRRLLSLTTDLKALQEQMAGVESAAAPGAASSSDTSAPLSPAPATSTDASTSVVTGDGYLRTHFDRVPDFGQFPTIRNVKGGNWSDPSVWEGGVLPAAGDVVEIVAGTGVVYDVVSDVPLETVAVRGKLRFHEDSNTRLTVRNLLVYEEGTLQIGTAAKPIRPHVTAEVVFVDQPFDLTTDPDNPDPEQWGTGLLGFGKIEVHGAVKDQTFVRLAEEPRAGDTTLRLAQPVSGWRPGDWLLLPDTRQYPDAQFADYYAAGQWEQVQLAAVSPDGLTLTLAGDGLQYDHLGARDGDGNLDLLPHVANMTRNVVFRSQNPNGTRAHSAFFERADVDIRYAQFSDMGRTRAEKIDNTVLDPVTETPLHIGTNQIARYPLHLHRLIGPETPQPNGRQATLVGNVIENGHATHNFKWGIVVHGSNYTLVEQNVVYNTGGAGIVGEDGSESGNIIEQNFTVRTFIGTEGKDGQPLGEVTTDERGDIGAGIWFHGPNNYIRNNVAANSYTAGIVVNTAGLSSVQIPAYQGEDHHVPGGGQMVEIRALPLLEFSGNEAYSTRFGASIWGIGGRSDFLWDVDTSVVKDLTVWNPSKAALEFWRIHRFVFDGLVARADFSKIDQGGGPTTLSVRATHYPTRNIVFRDADIQGFNVAFGQLPTFLLPDVIDEAFLNDKTPPLDYYPLAQGTVAELRIEDSYFRNRTNILITTPEGAVPDYASPQRIVIRNVRFDAVDPTDPSERDIDLQFWPRNRPNDGRDATAPFEVLVYDYNGQSGNDFQLFFYEQSPFYEVPVSGARRDMTGVPDLQLTNAESFDRYGIAVAGQVAPTSQTLPRIGALVGPLPGDPPLALPEQPPVVFFPELSRSFDRHAVFLEPSNLSGGPAYRATFRWYTNVPSESRVEETQGRFAPVGDATLKNVHTYVVDGLTPGQTYQYRIVATDEQGRVGTSGVLSFTVPDASGDTTPPVISGLGNRAVSMTATTATIAWITDEVASSQIELGTLPGQYDMLSETSTLLTREHFIQLTGLEPNTVYYFRARSTDAAGNTSTSAEFSFTTLPSPQPQTVVYAPETGIAEQPQRFIVAATDVDSFTTSLFAVQWGDGSPGEFISARNGEAIEHVFAQEGTYTVSIAAITPRGISPIETREITIEPPQVTGQLVPREDSSLVDLVVTGTSGVDVIGVLPSIDDRVLLFVAVANSVENVQIVPFDGVTGSVIVDGRGGDDAILADLLDLPVQLIGGAGSDLLIGGLAGDQLDGGDGNDILLGGIHNVDGGDVLLGGAGRDLIAGHLGEDLLSGGADDDLLIAGRLDYASALDAVLALQGEWISDNSYADRVMNLTLGGGANGNVVLDPGATVSDDGQLDALIGDGGLDWFLSSLLSDVILDTEADEQVLDLLP